MIGIMEKVEVGAAVYYKAPRPAYAVRKSTLVEIVEYPFRRCGPDVFRTEYVLANGVRLQRWDAFATREAVEELKSSLAFKKIWLTNLQHEMAREEEALRRLERRKQ